MTVRMATYCLASKNNSKLRELKFRCPFSTYHAIDHSCTEGVLFRSLYVLIFYTSTFTFSIRYIFVTTFIFLFFFCSDQVSLKDIDVWISSAVPLRDFVSEVFRASFVFSVHNTSSQNIPA